jgi:HEAT repeat protein
MDFEQAVALLEYAANWPEATQALVELGDRRALAPLLRAYEMAEEEDDCLSLLDGMEALDPVAGAAELVAAGDTDSHRLGLHLMELFPDNAHFPLLEEAIQSDDPLIRRQAARSILCQYPGPTWERLLLRLLSDDDPHLRSLAVEGLQYVNSPPVLQALRDQFARETEPRVKQDLSDALAGE